MKPMTVLVMATLMLSACQDYTPRAKEAHYDPKTGALVLPYPCPDWSKSSAINYTNSNHSNFGCATAGNIAAQLESPSDLYEGHGSASPDAEITTHAVEQYRADRIPVALQPQQSISGTSQ